MFDRFRQSAEHGGSAGPGLAIADSIIRSTDGQWRLGDSSLGGALFEVSWRRISARHLPVGGAAPQSSGDIEAAGSSRQLTAT